MTQSENAPATPEPTLRNGEASTNEPATKSEFERAEAIADKIGETVAALALDWGRKLLYAGAVVRESVEDIWAEAQSIRRGNKS